MGDSRSEIGNGVILLIAYAFLGLKMGVVFGKVAKSCKMLQNFAKLSDFAVFAGNWDVGVE